MGRVLRPGWLGPAARYVHRVKSPAGIQSLFPDSNDLPSCGSPGARRLSLLFPRVWFKSDYSTASSENTVFPGLATLPAGDRATGLAEAWLQSRGGGAWGLEWAELLARGLELGGLKGGEPQPGSSLGAVGRVPTHRGP